MLGKIEGVGTLQNDYMHMDMRSVLVGFLSVTRGQRCVGIPITNEIRLGNLT